jgi:uncharacterized membrane protein YfcA
MDRSTIWLIAVSIGVMALLYASVGHAGASGYLAVMALAGVAPSDLRPIALVLNVVVSVLTTVHFVRAGHFRWRLFWPFALPAVPMAFLGGWLPLPASAARVLIGVVLVAAAARFLLRPVNEAATRPPRPVPASLWGAGLGLLAGLSGTGGGIFLSPLLVLRRWARSHEAAATSAVFILVNSLSGLAAHLLAGRPVPTPALPWSLAALIGGFLGAWLGSNRLPAPVLRRLLALVISIAGGKLLLSA